MCETMLAECYRASEISSAMSKTWIFPSNPVVSTASSRVKRQKGQGVANISRALWLIPTKEGKTREEIEEEILEEIKEDEELEES